MRLDTKLSTRITEREARRLRVYAAAHAMNIGEVVNAALDALLPSLPELGQELARDVPPVKEAVPDPLRSTREETH